MGRDKMPALQGSFASEGGLLRMTNWKVGRPQGSFAGKRRLLRMTRIKRRASVKDEKS
jgi:hypothetical protein